MDKLGKYHYKYKIGKKTTDYRIVAIDTEWAKNWKSEIKTDPFCLCIHSIYFDFNEKIKTINLDDLYMESELYFRNDNESMQEYIDISDLLISKYLNKKTLFLGHQISSDLHTFINCSKRQLTSISQLVNLCKNRKTKKLGEYPNIADTRYDIKQRITGNGQEKLRNVSLRLKVFAVQNELNKLSLTKMYNLYSKEDHDTLKREMLSIMNWRHAFQTALVWMVDFTEGSVFNSKYNREFLVTNDIIYEMGKNDFEYLKSKEYIDSTLLKGIYNYVNKYYPEMSALCEE